MNDDSNKQDISQNIVSINITDEMKRSYLDYAMSVIVSRAIPNVCDGLKPVHRRILYSMYESGYHFNRAYKKSARVVGDVIGKYHPHGDVAVYDALVRLAQPFSMRIPLVDGQGNFGSIDGDSAAAMRYTESRLEKVAHNLLLDLDKDTVDFQANYDGSESEPIVLPALFPNILVNGSSGIAVGMATNIPPHNLIEVVDACCHLIDNSSASVDDLMTFIKGPDFPSGGTILGMNGICSAYTKGKGIIINRGKTEIEDIGNRKAVVITEIPFMVNKAKLIEKIAELANEKRIDGISDLRDESNKHGIRVVIELKRDIMPEVIQNQLYSYTQLQSSFGVIMLVLKDNIPLVMDLKQVLSSFLEFREIVVTRRTIFLLNKARDRAHLLFGLIVAVDNIDEVVALIKSASDPSQAKELLLAKIWKIDEALGFVKLIDDRIILVDNDSCRLTEEQVKAILEMRLQRLTAMEKNKILDEIHELKREIDKYLAILGSRELLLNIIRDELIQIRNEFGTPRLTEILYSEFEDDIEDLIQREDMVVTVTHTGYIKRVPLDTYRAQRRGGKGRSGANIHDDDVITQLFVGSTHTPMLFFSNFGKVYSLKLYKLPSGGPQSKGRPLVNILNLAENEKVTNIMPMPENVDSWDDLHIVFSTSLGNIRRNDLSDFKHIPSNGKIAIRLEENDSLVSVDVCHDHEDLLLATSCGKAVRCPVQSVRVFKSRTSDGVRGIKLAKDDRVISVAILNGANYSATERDEYLSIPIDTRKQIKSLDHEQINAFVSEHSITLSTQQLIEMSTTEQFILSVSTNGFGKISSSYEYRTTDRGGSGIVNMSINTKIGNVLASMVVKPNYDAMLITNNGQLIRLPLDSIRITGRSTSGVILFKTATGETVVSCALVESSDDNETNDTIEIEENI